ncbi:hypothetical protein ES703_123150 [subsurface metagenome]
MEWQIYHLKHKPEPDETTKTKDRHTETEKLQTVIEDQKTEIARLKKLFRNAGIDPNSDPNNIKKLMTEEEENAYQKRLTNYRKHFDKKRIVAPPSKSTAAKIELMIADQLKGTNNLNKPYLRNIDVVQQVHGGWGVFVEYNAGDNLWNGLIKAGIEKKMSEIYIALYTSTYDIRAASVSAYFPLIDKYGKQSDDVVYKSMLSKNEADKTNWAADSAFLKLDILPTVWTTSILHLDFR